MRAAAQALGDWRLAGCTVVVKPSEESPHTAALLGEWLWRDLAYRIAVGAACIAGVLDIGQAMQVVCARSRLMRRVSGLGAMARKRS